MPSSDDACHKLPNDWAARCAAVKADLAGGAPMSLGRIADDLGISFELFAWMIAQQALRAGIPVFLSHAGQPPMQVPTKFN